MNPLLKTVLLGLCTTSLFCGAFVGAALMRGAGLHELPVVGSVFAPPPDETGEQASPEAQRESAEDALPLDAHPKSAGIGLLDVFRLDSPIAGEELRELADELKRKRARADQRAREQDEREERLTERAQLLDEQFASLQDLRTGLETWELELEAQQEEVERDTSARAEREADNWQRMAKLFEKGEAETLVRKLQAYTPAEAAKVLHNLKPDRARELLEALSGETWKDYWDAYKDAPQPSGERPE